MLKAARTPASAAAVTFVGLLIPFVVTILSGTISPIELMRVGEQSKAADFVEARYGTDVITKGDAGYDGIYFWVVADQLPDLDAAARHLDDAPYRMQRILPSALAALTGGGTPAAAALILVSVAGSSLFVYSLADLAVRHGRDARLGFLALIPILFSIGYSTGEPLAFGLGFLGLCFADRDRHGLAILLITLGSLSRESVAVFGLGVALGLLISMIQGERPLRAPVLAGYVFVPLGVTLGWGWWLRQHFESAEVINRIVPLGIFDASASGILMGVAVLALGLLGAWHWRDVAVVWGTSLGFAAGTLLYYGPFFLVRALPRASAPAIALGLAAAAATMRRGAASGAAAAPAAGGD